MGFRLGATAHHRGDRRAKDVWDHVRAANPSAGLSDLRAAADIIIVKEALRRLQCPLKWAPGKLQLAIRKIFEHATRRVTVPGVQVVPVPLFEALDAKDARDYEQRVEPSATGGSVGEASAKDRERCTPFGLKPSSVQTVDS